jgi:quercetin dioxygenase-like cupin family protein
MSDTTFLGGRVHKRSLPVVAPPAPANAPVCKRLLLPQGELAQFHDSSDGFRYAAVIELRPGTTRGNHYHRHKMEVVYLISGEVRVLVEDTATATREAILLRPGDLLTIPPGIAHAMQPTAAGYAVELSPTRFEPEDTCKHRVL